MTLPNKKSPARNTATAAKAMQGSTTSLSTAAPSPPPSPTKPTKVTVSNDSDDVLTTLNELIKKLDAFLAENAELRKRNNQLDERNNQLAERIEHLEKLLSDKNDKPPPAVVTSTSPAPEPVPKIRYDALILSDSIMRHVGGDLPTRKMIPPEEPHSKPVYEQDLPYVAPKPYAKLLVKKVISPGARAAKLYNIARELSKTYSFDHIICHVGTNYVPYEHANDTIEEVSDLLAELKLIFKCKVTYSPILPRISMEDREADGRNLSPESLGMLNTIQYINTEIYRFCKKNYIGTALCQDFVMDPQNPVPVKYLLAKDGCHLNRRGIVAMEHSVCDAINAFAGLK